MNEFKNMIGFVRARVEQRSEEDETRRTIAKKLKTIRGENKLSQSDIGEALGVSWVSVSRWENGQSTPAKRYIKKLTKLIETLEKK